MVVLFTLDNILELLDEDSKKMLKKFSILDVKRTKKGIYFLAKDLSKKLKVLEYEILGVSKDKKIYNILEFPREAKVVLFDKNSPIPIMYALAKSPNGKLITITTFYNEPFSTSILLEISPTETFEDIKSIDIELLNRSKIIYIYYFSQPNYKCPNCIHQLVGIAKPDGDFDLIKISPQRGGTDAKYIRDRIKEELHKLKYKSWFEFSKIHSIIIDDYSNKIYSNFIVRKLRSFNQYSIVIEDDGEKEAGFYFVDANDWRIP